MFAGTTRGLESAPADAPGTVAQQGEDAQEETGAPPAAEQDRRQAYAVLWGLGLIAGLYILGYEIAVPLFMLAYFTFADRIRWPFAIGSAAVMGLMTTGLFSNALGIVLPQGLVLRLLAGG